MNNNYAPQNGAPKPPPIFINQPKKSYTWIWVTAIAAVAIIAILFGVIFISAIGGSGNSQSNEFNAPTDDYVAVIHIEGTIASSTEVSLFNSSGAMYNHGYVLNVIEQLKYSDSNKGIMLYIDSPGGEVYAVDEVYLALMDYKHETGRPIYAYCATYAASGGYYLAAAADHISSNRMGTLGSIGVTYGTHLDISGLLEKYGIKATAITSGDNKAMGDITQPLTPEQLEIYQSQIDEYYEVFVDIVANGRPDLTREKIYALADGRTYTASQALEAGLIDSIGDYDGSVSNMIENCGLTDNVKFVDYEYVYTASYDELMNLFAAEISENASTAIDPIDLAVLASSRYSLKGALVYYNGK